LAVVVCTDDIARSSSCKEACEFLWNCALFHTLMSEVMLYIVVKNKGLTLLICLLVSEMILGLEASLHRKMIYLNQFLWFLLQQRTVKVRGVGEYGFCV